MQYKNLFGPVRSRRLGLSLGIDMVPFKTCTLDCIYCECGATTELIHERKEYVPARDIIEELNHYLSTHPSPDYVTLGGSGEPTLHSQIDTIINHVKSNYPSIKVALLTNSTFFHLPEVRRGVLGCDIVLPSLDAVSTQVFEKINKPAVSVDCEMLIDGLVEFSREFKGQIWLEVFIVPGINDTEQELKLFKETIQRIKPTRIQLNSLDRPGTCSWLTAASPEELATIAEFMKPLPVEIVSRNFAEPLPGGSQLQEQNDALMSLLKRRPSTLEDISVSLGITLNAASILVENSKKRDLVSTKEVNNRIYYTVEN
ncbi:radical SAM protein [Chitinispirillales bacterium ANBcel5]|uniref:radical SAM protein n=1 Tax=Cellulosispirillum alkaliphilum TaxID=3039283 RepID=UPI002A597B9C|nr:radical SAM protein [Chitinispirillales bacterium ANBcel5]